MAEVKVYVGESGARALYRKVNGEIVNLANNVYTKGEVDTALDDVRAGLALKEDLDNKVSAWSSPTDAQYPSALLVKNSLDELERRIGELVAFSVVQLTQDKPHVPDVQEPSSKIIYLTKDASSGDTDPFTEWIWDSVNGWQVIGETTVDLSGYVRKVGGATEGNLGSLAADGGLTDSGISGSSVGDALSKIGGIESGAQVNIIESISVNGTAVNPDANKNVAISIPKSVPDPSAPNQMLFSTDGSTWVPMTWETISFNTVTIGGKQYTTATVGSQIWLVGNLDLTWDGLAPSEAGTAYLNEPRANYYSDDESTYGWNGKKYGLLYNWAAVRYMDEHANTLFEGWHVPTSDEWNTLKQSLGTSGAYELMTTTEWTAGNGSDLYGFSAVPSGIRGASPSYSYGGNGSRANFWTKTHPGDSKIVATMWTMRGDNGAFYYDDGAFKDTQGSVRLVKDA